MTFAIRNIVRQMSHSIMTLVAVALGVVALILSGGWVQDIFVQLGEALIHSQSGHMQVYKKGFYAAGARTPEKYLIEDPRTLAQSIAGRAGVEDVMARL